jgi:serine/threonine protein kinase
MSQRFFRCVYCGLPHDVMQTICPATGKSIERRRLNSGSIPAQRDSNVGASSRPSPPRARVAPPAPAPIPVPDSSPPPAGRHISTMPPRANRDLIGKTIGHKYLVRSVLGEGGMGSVFEAENIVLGRSVAVKVLHPAQARKKTAVKRFHQEARAAGAIGHPNICEVYDLGTLDDGSPYLVMERLVGETLADRIASEGGLAFEDVIDVLTQVLSGLVAAHEKGIVHRDIKPENVFLTRRVGCPPLAKLLDFGVSKMITPIFGNEKDEDLDLTRTGMVMGTPFYMSPEQARGDRNLDARVDLYACGIMMYEAITGKRPFTAANYNALLLQILTTKPRPARELRPAMPLGFDEVLDKALARSREERFQTAAAFQRELQALRDRHPQTAVGIDVSEVARHLRKSAPSAPVNLQRQAPAVRPITPSRAVRPPAPPPPPPPPPPEPESEPEFNSVDIDIPVMFSDTPLSGEQLPADATSVDDIPANMRDRFASSSDADTTERRADLGHLAIGKRPRAGGLRVPRSTTTERESRPSFTTTSDTEIDDGNATLIQSAPGRRKTRPLPDDTVRVEANPHDSRVSGTPTGDTPITRPRR